MLRIRSTDAAHEVSGQRVLGLAVGVALLAGTPAVATLQHDDDDWRGGRLEVVGLTHDARLFRFDEDRPRRARDIGQVRGLTGDSRLVGIDYRPATGADGSRGVLYGVGDKGGVYSIDDRSGSAMKRSR